MFTFSIEIADGWYIDAFFNFQKSPQPDILQKIPGFYFAFDVFPSIKTTEGTTRIQRAKERSSFHSFLAFVYALEGMKYTIK